MPNEPNQEGERLPLIKADWAGELEELRRSALRTLGGILGIAGYTWLFSAALAMHPEFAPQPLLMPLAFGALGLLILLCSSHRVLRSVVFLAGMIAISCLTLFVLPSAASPFVLIIAVSASSLAAPAMLPFVMAAISSGLIMLAYASPPSPWPLELVLVAVALCWGAALAAWLTSRNLYLVLGWALRGYEQAWETNQELQSQRGKLNQTLRALADANTLLKRTMYDLTEARQEAETARQLKSQFAANISHELRTPLHLIVGFSQLMCTSPENYAGVTWTPELRGDVQEIYDSAQHLLRLIDDILDLAQVEAARLPVSKEKVSLCELVLDSVDTAKSLLRERNISLITELPPALPQVFADPTRIRQVLLNLLNNAARFTDKGSITVRAWAREDEIEVVVEDTGVGIPEDQLQEIFRDFHQIDSSIRRRNGGTGLGLAICKQFITLHQGRIWAESKLGEGSAFHFTLPLPHKVTVHSQESRLPEGWRYPAKKPEVPKRVVTLTHPQEFARLLTRYLPSFEVHTADNELDVARLARQKQADAIVLPWELASETLQENLARSTADLMLPVITCSLPLERHLALAKGFDYCLMKPFTADRLSETLHQAAPAARKILAVDDDPGVVRLIRQCLKNEDQPLEVIPAYDGEEAIRLLAKDPEAVLLDLLLPKANGLQVLQAIRQRPRGANIPVIAITAYGFEQDVATSGTGTVYIKRGRHFSSTEFTTMVQSFVEIMPARHLSLDGA